MNEESSEDRAERILDELRAAYPGKKTYELGENEMHFVCEVEPVEEHPEYDKAVEVIISSEPHQHLKMTQVYKVLKGSLTLFVEDKVIPLHTGDTYTVKPGNVHWAKGNGNSWVEIYSTPGWTKEDHIPAD
jgi:mannose-6-phosphate isomerase-like protein (cupin superfamily)